MQFTDGIKTAFRAIIAVVQLSQKVLQLQLPLELCNIAQHIATWLLVTYKNCQGGASCHTGAYKQASMHLTTSMCTQSQQNQSMHTCMQLVEHELPSLMYVGSPYDGAY